MANYKVEITNSARKEIKKLSSAIIPRILEEIESLSKNPYPQDCKKLKPNIGYRVRVGDYRIIYDISQLTLIIKIIRVRHRKDAYK